MQPHPETTPVTSCTIIDATDRSIRQTLGETSTLARLIWVDAGLASPPLCSGLARCGRCRVRITEAAPAPHEDDREFFSAEDISAGWRLACRHAPAHGMVVHVPLPVMPHRHASRPKHPGPFRLAVDLGTTSLQWSLLAPDGTVAAQGSETNPQMGAGSDVMSRIAMARSDKGRGRLRELVLQALRRIVADVEGTPATADAVPPAGSGDEPTTACGYESRVEELCVAGNTAMTAILADESVEGLASAPYRLEMRGGTALALPGLPPAWIPPLPAPFVGGDLSAGYLAVLTDHAPAFPFVLADLGTNGEFVLALSPERTLVTSVALGPALEGIGLTFGTVAQRGAITSFTLTPGGLVPYVLDGGEADGISGTGYISLVHALLRAGLLDVDGRFIQSPSSPLAARMARSIVSHRGEPCLPLARGLYLAARDIEEILKVKAAFSLAFERLLATAQMPSHALSGIHLAGALGQHALPADLEGLGFIPPGSGGRTRAVGNTSLRGAELLLTSPPLRDTLNTWREGCTVVDLTAAPDFSAAFLRHMHFHF
ncbi:iron-sulfur cluster-binding protein, putative [Nitratidesulfovibrio vulgaris str. Hildenborough]|uniref:Iron-sulfur cluster-binding protein, putative n=1 Tax=Nitratidesulfovibrio vulgaris (strain ATCC 29579 / DSM 644 / CCUG 34227 / NCIMB 8303 / VKM B-1760 / Hildenborough) TaxID=882 RepID=Q72DM1_NITV2|nr:iron-sulfur cluster-binding protein, putative [Nitratidesulfovibrio vulgaris str. Hildenborough]